MIRTIQTYLTAFHANLRVLGQSQLLATRVKKEYAGSEKGEPLCSKSTTIRCPHLPVGRALR